ncbi:MAG TPA: HAMP domain-containing sensor histidine kinase [Anaeromyxobacteraceae bacterium]|nr:HAMP domain-containing sensor histidine kinase [Anaeromyxobacteraceae bacterium]
MKLRRVYPLIIGFVVVPAAMMLTVGILILVFGRQAVDYVFGILILALVATTIIGTVATLVVLYREAYLSRLQTDFVNKVSHDLRTPLTSIRMFVETLQMGRLADEAQRREALDIIAAETARLSSLISRLLDWARMESGKRTFDLRRQPLGPIVDDALRAVEPQRLQTGAEVRREVPGDLPPVLADRDALGDALVDLLQNAFKYTGAEKRIAITARKAGNAVEVVVSDNGPGIPGADQKRIFDKFYRGKDPLERSIEGSGLGLSMVKHVVEAHGGKVSVRSEVGKGAAFSVFLRLAEGDGT